MGRQYVVTESGVPHSIPLDGPTVFAFEDGQVLIKYWRGKEVLFHPIFPDQTLLEIVRLRQQARAALQPEETQLPVPNAT